MVPNDLVISDHYTRDLYAIDHGQDVLVHHLFDVLAIKSLKCRRSHVFGRYLIAHLDSGVFYRDRHIFRSDGHGFHTQLGRPIRILRLGIGVDLFVDFPVLSCREKVLLRVTGQLRLQHLNGFRSGLDLGDDGFTVYRGLDIRVLLYVHASHLLTAQTIEFLQVLVDVRHNAGREGECLLDLAGALSDIYDRKVSNRTIIFFLYFVHGSYGDLFEFRTFFVPVIDLDVRAVVDRLSSVLRGFLRIAGDRLHLNTLQSRFGRRL